MPTKAKRGIIPLYVEQLGRVPWLLHGFSTRHGGISSSYGGKSLNLGFTKGESKIVVERNRKLFLRAMGAVNGKRTWPMVTLRQLHSDLIHCISELPATQLSGDGLITCVPGILLAVQTADCLPVILVDTRTKAVGVFHAGWRGTLKRIVEKGAGEMRKWFGTRPRDIQAAIGPGVRGCCYTVGAEVKREFESQFAYARELFRETKESDPIREKYPMLFLTARAPGHSDLPVEIFLDLPEANRRQLISAGVPAKQIDISTLCSVCRKDLLFSHRGENGVTGRMMAVAGIRPQAG